MIAKFRIISGATVGPDDRNLRDRRMWPIGRRPRLPPHASTAPRKQAPLDDDDDDDDDGDDDCHDGGDALGAMGTHWFAIRAVAAVAILLPARAAAAAIAAAILERLKLIGALGDSPQCRREGPSWEME